jgi:aminoglycoside 2''-phosphotransferase
MPVPRDLVDQIRRSWPEFPADDVCLQEGGQNHWVLDTGRLVVRGVRYPTPARKASLSREAALLHRIGPRLPLPVPAPVRVLVDASDVSYFAYPRLTGVPLQRERFRALPQTTRSTVLDDLLRFLAALNALVDAVGDLEGLQSNPLEQWTAFYARVRRAVLPGLPAPVQGRVQDHFERFLSAAARHPLPSRLIHGDFGTTNILLDPARGRVAGILDFSEAHLDDPAVDLAALRASFGSELLSRPGCPQAGDVLARMDFYEGTFALQDAVFGQENGDRAAWDAGLAGAMARFAVD